MVEEVKPEVETESTTESTTETAATAMSTNERAELDAYKPGDALGKFDDMLEAFKRRFDEMNREALSNLAVALCGGLRDAEEYKHQKQVKTAKEAASFLKGRKKITIMTGAGISAASGIPTFRGQDGFWKETKSYAGEADPQQVLTRRFFNENPMAVWEWHHDFYKLMVGKQTNAGHVAINKFQEHCASTPAMEAFLLTQNIDDLHNRLIRKSQILSNTEDRHCQLTDNNRAAFTPHIYEIHGNVHYMHCSDETEEHSRVLFPAPNLQAFDQAYKAAHQKKITSETGVTQNFCLVPCCDECGKDMKPHCMFFDETYSEHYYRKETVEKFVEDSDALIVVGTALATNLAKKVVASFLNREMPVIEVNLESSINVGHNIQVLEKSEIALPALFNEYYRLYGLPTVNQQAAPAVKKGVAKGKRGASASAAAASGNRKVSPKVASRAPAKGKKK